MIKTANELQNYWFYSTSESGIKSNINNKTATIYNGK